MHCRVCQSSSVSFGKAKILDKYLVSYYRCEKCGFIQTEDPYWLEEAYSEAITQSDVGLIRRNLQMAAQTQNFLSTCFDQHGKFVDYGGGYGIFARLMRDNGFDFYHYDPLCNNLFAEGFDATPNMNYALLTAWEVFEHLQNPLAEIEKMLSFSRNLLFSTILLPKIPKPLNEWWYYGIEHGQHISFYSIETLRIIAQKFNLKVLYSNGSLHFMGKANINPFLIRIALDRRLCWLRKLISKPAPLSLIENDYHTITGKYLR